jgi:hypothetical protein
MSIRVTVISPAGTCNGRNRHDCPSDWLQRQHPSTVSSQNAQSRIVFRAGARRLDTRQKGSCHAMPQTEDTSVTITVDGLSAQAKNGELLLDAVLRHREIPHICYHSPLMGPIRSCDTCIVEMNGRLVRTCGGKVEADIQIRTGGAAEPARKEAFDVILGNHMLYCTVCDNSNGNCRMHNTAVALAVKH